jgi:hypothetical protein
MMEGAGLELLSFQDLNPHGAAATDDSASAGGIQAKGTPEGKLTVSLWLGQKLAAPGKTTKRNSKLEVTA